ncbi:MAG TPA: histidine phosphatase family protein [Acidimicrobiales bacterium]|nr:histidine phosphatase family protein [Acidimicrobiales bacterium]
MSFDENLPPEGFRQRGLAPTETRLLLIRHGESYANLHGVAGGPRGDGGLTDAGRAQARALARRLAITRELASASALYTSTLPRAIETGAIVFPAINASLEPTADESLCELGVGEADGLTWTEIGRRYAAPNWDVDPSQTNVPGGESLLEFFQRCVEAIERLVARHPRELVVLVVHGGFIEQAMKLYQGFGGGVRMQPRIENCSMTEIEFASDYRRLLRYNDLSPIGVE